MSKLENNIVNEKVTQSKQELQEGNCAVVLTSPFFFSDNSRESLNCHNVKIIVFTVNKYTIVKKTCLYKPVSWFSEPAF